MAFKGGNSQAQEYLDTGMGRHQSTLDTLI